MTSAWDEIEKTLVDLYSLPHNRINLRGTSPEAEAKKKLNEIKSGIGSAAPEDYHGPALFLRVVGPTNRAYSGEWWFEAKLLDDLDSAFSRIYFNDVDKKRVLRDMLRDLLAVSQEWNMIHEVWALELPQGQVLRGYWGSGNAQQLIAGAPLSAKGNRKLVGKARQIFFPVKNPLWIRRYQNLLP
jgi:hypothetical protein